MFKSAVDRSDSLLPGWLPAGTRPITISWATVRERGLHPSGSARRTPISSTGSCGEMRFCPLRYTRIRAYFRKGTAVSRSAFHAASTMVVTKNDNGTRGPNYANVLGNLSPEVSQRLLSRDRSWLRTDVSDAFTVTAEGVIGSIFIEFWPDISRHLLPPAPDANGHQGACFTVKN